MKPFFFLVSFCFFGLQSFCQVYLDGGKTRHRFAQLNLGLETRFFPSKNTQTEFNSNFGIAQTKSLSPLNEFRFIIGGTHFWGHADFYVAIPVYSISTTGFRTGVETGAKVFPWAIKKNKFRPYAGFAWIPTSYLQAKGATIITNNWLTSAGFVFQHQNKLLELGLGRLLINSTHYFISPTNSIVVKTPKTYFNFSLKFSIETTLNAESDWQSGKTKQVTETLAKAKKLNGFTIAVGPSSSIFLKESNFNSTYFNYQGQHKFSNLFADFGIGYYFHQPDLQLNIAYRNITSKISGYGSSQLVNRKSIAFEAFKFINDYHGFVMFFGPAISYELLNAEQIQPNSNPYTANFNGFKPGLTFGWDIRPNRIQSFYLRTNLRWFPNLNVEMYGNKKLNMSQLEFNFIQLVIFPQRIFG